jgi:hypothetical protein
MTKKERKSKLEAVAPHGVGVPVLAGSAAYAICAARVWRGTLEDKLRMAKKFYTVVAVSMLLGLLLNYPAFMQ